MKIEKYIFTEDFYVTHDSEGHLASAVVCDGGTEKENAVRVTGIGVTRYPEEEDYEPYAYGLWQVEAEVGGKRVTEYIIDFFAGYACAAFALVLKERGIDISDLTLISVCGAQFDLDDIYEKPVFSYVKPLINPLVRRAVWQTTDAAGYVAEAILHYESINTEADLYLRDLKHKKWVEEHGYTLRQYTYDSARDLCICDGAILSQILRYDSLCKAVTDAATDEEAINAAIWLSFYTHHDISLLHRAYRLIIDEDVPSVMLED